MLLTALYFQSFLSFVSKPQQVFCFSAAAAAVVASFSSSTAAVESAAMAARLNITLVISMAAKV